MMGMNDSHLDVSVVVPLYDEEESLPELTAWIDRVMHEHDLSYELIFVDDGSDDGSWGVVEQLKTRFPAIRAFGFARNYGKSAALYCGFAAAQGRSSSRWMPICRILPMKYPNCGV